MMKLKDLLFGFKRYQKLTHKTAIYPKRQALVYLSLGLVSEAGEVAGKVKKVIRDKDGEFDKEDIKALKDELGDALWYISELCNLFDARIKDVAQDNIAKLNGRKCRGTLKGSGDKR